MPSPRAKRNCERRIGHAIDSLKPVKREDALQMLAFIKADRIKQEQRRQDA